MFELRAYASAFRSCVVATCLASLAACIPEPVDAPAQAPTSLSATAGNATVTLAWSGSSDATGYSVKRSTSSGGPYTAVATATSSGYTDSSVVNGATYYYVVSALNAGGESADSAQTSATPSVPSAPLAPTNVTATAGNTQVSLTWSASSGATSYRVRRATISGGPYTQVAAPTTTTYVDTGLSNGTTYYYVVSAVNAIAESANSAQVSAAPAPAPPTNFGTWINVTPAGVNLASGTLGGAGCGNAGARTVQADPARPSNLYAEFNCQGIWKSVDYGATWTGPVNTGTNGAAAGDCEGGITISPTSMAAVPTIYQSCIRGAGAGFWKSIDGGVNWIRYNVAPGGSRQDYLPPVVDPYDQNHLLMTGHEFDSLAESIDGGLTWTSVSLVNGMLQSVRSAYVFFINTGSASTSRGSWLWLGEQSGGAAGTWRTSNGGTSWVQVDKNEHLVGAAQIYQPDNNGVVYMAGAYSDLGFGVLRSADYGQTWTHVGTTGTANLPFGTAKNVYSLGPGVFEVGAQPGTGTWVTPPSTPAAVVDSPVQVAVVNDGTSNIFLGAFGNNGVWRYIEP